MIATRFEPSVGRRVQGIGNSLGRKAAMVVALVLLMSCATVHAKRPVDVRVLEVQKGPPPRVQYKVQLILRNHTKKLRWFAIPENLERGLNDEITVTARELRAFKEAPGAVYFRFSGDRSFTIVPVWPKGSLTLTGWLFDGVAASGEVHIWALDQLLVDGHRISESEKVNPNQVIHDPHRIRRIKTKSYDPAVKARLLVHEKIKRPLR